MSAVSRRGLFGLFAAALAAPALAPMWPKSAPPAGAPDLFDLLEARIAAAETAMISSMNYTFYSGYEVLNITPSDILTAAEFDWKAAAAA